MKGFVRRTSGRIRTQSKFVLITLILMTGSLTLFSSPKLSAEENSGMGVGPVTELKIENIDEGKAKAGKEIFVAKCSACHKMEERYVGPALKDVFKRRKPEWIANMMLNPEEMLQKDPVAQELLAEYLVKMTFQDVSKEQAEKIVGYFKYYSEKGEIAEPAANNANSDVSADTKSTKKKPKKK